MKMKNTLKGFFNNKKAEKTVMGLIVATFVLGLTLPAYAAGEPAIFTNGVAFLKALLKWILILVVPAAGVMIAWQAFKKMLADGDIAVVASSNKAMKNTLIAGAIVLSAAGIVQSVLVFFT
jgi:hypothetical protein